MKAKTLKQIKEIMWLKKLMAWKIITDMKEYTARLDMILA